MVRKKKVLLYWFEMDRRPELMQPFTEIADSIDFTQIYYRMRSERKEATSPLPMLYWFDFSNPFELLKKVQPDLIVGATETLQGVSLIAAAQQMNIPFYGLQHGFTTGNLLEIIKPGDRPLVLPRSRRTIYRKTAQFYFGSLRPQIFFSRIGQYLRFLRLFYKKFAEAAIAETRYSWEIPDKYICFSKVAGEHYKMLYNLREDQLAYTGILSFDGLFRSMQNVISNKPQKPYYLLIDTSFKDFHKGVQRDAHERCYRELAAFCRMQGADLKIKLHPLDYWRPNFDDPDSETLRDLPMDRLAELIVNATGCFGFYSTLTIPIAFTKPTVQIKYDDVFEPLLVEQGVTPVLDFYNFSASNIRFPEMTERSEQLKKDFLFSTDGNSAERLKQIIIDAPCGPSHK